MTEHRMTPSAETLHGAFAPDLEPVFTIASGDSVQYELLDAGWGLEGFHADGSPRRTFEPRDQERDPGHALCGPVAIEGARPGMTLEVRIGELRTGSWGWNASGGADIERFQRFGVADAQRETLRWSLDRRSMIATNQHRHRVAMRPFLGVMGMPPDEPGRHSTAPPRVTGGNIDCRELVSGTALYLPVAVDGGLFSCGDGHAAQGDGEVSGTAIECPMEHAVLTFRLHEEMALTTPRARTSDAWLTFGFDEDLDEAMYTAMNDMLDLIQDLHEVSRTTALSLASTAVDLRITQIVNGAKGVHAVLNHGAIR
ncbi:MAG: acetamidase/formamidase family protein [Chloroflexota bacterium]